jgi:hypothetical protein
MDKMTAAIAEVSRNLTAAKNTVENISMVTNPNGEVVVIGDFNPDIDPGNTIFALGNRLTFLGATIKNSSEWAVCDDCFSVYRRVTQKHECDNG